MNADGRLHKWAVRLVESGRSEGPKLDGPRKFTVRKNRKQTIQRKKLEDFDIEWGPGMNFYKHCFGPYTFGEDRLLSP